jgi:hypothetical protein
MYSVQTTQVALSRIYSILAPALLATTRAQRSAPEIGEPSGLGHLTNQKTQNLLDAKNYGFRCKHCSYLIYVVISTIHENNTVLNFFLCIILPVLDVLLDNGLLFWEQHSWLQSVFSPLHSIMFYMLYLS